MKNVGGQAVLEGVMMRGSSCVATAIRTPDGLIEILAEPIEYKRSPWRKTPVLRGVFSLVDSLQVGLRVMSYSSAFFEDEDETPSKVDQLADRLFPGKGDKVMTAVTFGFSMILALLLFTALPTMIAGWLAEDGTGRLTLNFMEAGIKILLFLLYLLGISRIPEIHRVFKYHGAEHKVIDAYEKDLELTVENVRGASRYHARCGTNFMFLVLMVSVAVFSFVPTVDPFLRVIFKILLVPVVTGLTFELILWLGASDSLVSRAVSTPGKLMQRITTAEPDDSMIEVAIVALKRSENIPYTIKELKHYADERLKGLDNASLDRDIILSHVTGFDRAYILAHPEAEVSFEAYEKFRHLVDQRRKHVPVGYLTGHKEFMGLDFLVDESTLIPRPDTETLVETAAAVIRSLERAPEDLKILDLCSGSGAVGLSLLHEFPEADLVLSDISAEAMAVAEKNAGRLGLADRTHCIVGNLFDNINTAHNFDVIVSNPPYIPSQEIRNLPRDIREYEPKKALDGGQDGLDFYRKISDKARQYINDGGWILFEIGSEQGADVAAILKEFNWQDPEVLSDLAGRARVVRATWIRDL